MSQVPPPITNTPEAWVPPIHGQAMRPRIYAPSHTGPSTMTLSAPDERSISTSTTTAMPPAPGERPANTSNRLDITQIPQHTSAHDKSERECNIRIYEQDIRSKQHLIQERRQDFNKLQEEVNRLKREMDRVMGDIEKVEGTKGMLETLLISEKKLKEKEDQCDSLINMVYNLTAEIPRPSLALPLPGTKRPPPDESQDRSTRRRTETAKD